MGIKGCFPLGGDDFLSNLHFVSRLQVDQVRKS